VYPGRLVGAAMGIVILVSVFLLPFGTLPGISDTSSTLYSAFGRVVSHLSAVESSGDTDLLTTDFMLVAAVIILTIAGLVGIFPLGSGVLGLIGVGMLTMSPYLNNDLTAPVTWGAAFYVIWLASFLSIAAAFWRRIWQPSWPEKPGAKSGNGPSSAPYEHLSAAPSHG